MEEIKFSAKVAKEMKSHENRGNFELKLSFRAMINSIKGVKKLILDLTT
jgi:hypothetical protein